jgi:hypothetical protein
MSSHDALTARLWRRQQRFTLQNLEKVAWRGRMGTILLLFNA